MSNLLKPAQSGDLIYDLESLLEGDKGLVTYHIIRYAGPFGFIKPWTAVRDDRIASQPFLTPSIVEGMRQKLEVSSILRHRLRYQGISRQLERIQPADWEVKKGKAFREQAILTRGLLLYPQLSLAFPTLEDAQKAATQHLCLCRNEDLIYPISEPEQISADEFDRLPGVELQFGRSEQSILVGYNRFEQAAEMYGNILYVEEE